MSALKRVIGFVARVIGYSSLASVIAAALILFTIDQGGVCPIFTFDTVACVSRIWQRLGEFAMTITRLTAASGLPLLFGLVGAIFAVRDLRRWRGRRAQQPPSIL